MIRHGRGDAARKHERSHAHLKKKKKHTPDECHKQSRRRRWWRRPIRLLIAVLVSTSELSLWGSAGIFYLFFFSEEVITTQDPGARGIAGLEWCVSPLTQSKCHAIAERSQDVNMQELMKYEKY